MNGARALNEFFDKVLDGRKPAYASRKVRQKYELTESQKWVLRQAAKRVNVARLLVEDIRKKIEVGDDGTVKKPEELWKQVYRNFGPKPTDLQATLMPFMIQFRGSGGILKEYSAMGAVAPRKFDFISQPSLRAITYVVSEDYAGRDTRVIEKLADMGFPIRSVGAHERKHLIDHTFLPETLVPMYRFGGPHETGAGFYSFESFSRAYRDNFAKEDLRKVEYQLAKYEKKLREAMSRGVSSLHAVYNKLKINQWEGCKNALERTLRLTPEVVSAIGYRETSFILTTTPLEKLPHRMELILDEFKPEDKQATKTAGGQN